MSSKSSFFFMQKNNRSQNSRTSSSGSKYDEEESKRSGRRRSSSSSSSNSLPPVNSSNSSGRTRSPKNKNAKDNSGKQTKARRTSLSSKPPFIMRRRGSLVPEQSLQDKGRMTVVLDMDETLVHSRLTGRQAAYRQQEERKESCDSLDEFKVTLDNGEIVWVNKRPGLDKFLQTMSELYEPIVYTAGLEEYASRLLDWLDPENKIFRARLYRDSCVFSKGYYVKDLSKCGRDLNRCVLVDNNAFCFLPQLGNGIPISSFFDDPQDTALDVLTNYLFRLDKLDDVRPFLRESFNLEVLLKEHRDQIMGRKW